MKISNTNWIIILLLFSFTLSIISCQRESDIFFPPTREKPKDSASAVVIDAKTRYLMDDDWSTMVSLKGAKVSYYVDLLKSVPVKSYTIQNGDSVVASDPASVIVEGSNDGKAWSAVDDRTGLSFPARFANIDFTVKHPGTYRYLKVTVQPAGGDVTKMSEFHFHERDILAGWSGFRYPVILYEDKIPGTNASTYFNRLIKDNSAFVRNIALQVNQVLNFDNSTALYRDKLQYFVEAPPNPPGAAWATTINGISTIVFEGNFWEGVYRNESFASFARGIKAVMLHELGHVYMNMPQGIPGYDGNARNVSWAYAEGMASAMSAVTHTDNVSGRTPGGSWMDGYSKGAWFYTWLNENKDPDFIRKFNQSCKTVIPWSFDGAMKSIFGNNVTTQSLWDEYQNAIK